MAAMHRRSERRIRCAIAVLAGAEDLSAKNLRQWSVHPFTCVPAGEELQILARQVISTVLLELLRAAPQEVTDRIEKTLNQLVFDHCFGKQQLGEEDRKALFALVFGRKQLE